MNKNKEMKSAREMLTANKVYSDDESIQALEDQITFIDNHGLSEMNLHLSSNAVKKNTFLAAIAEHNFLTQLINYNAGINIQYEPSESNRPIDFVYTKSNIKYSIQMKSLSISKRDNIQNKLISHLKNELTHIKINKYITIHKNIRFKKVDIPEFISYLNSNISFFKDNEMYCYPSKIDEKLQFSLFPPNKKNLNNLTLGISSDLSMIDITEESSEQIKGNLEKAIGAFETDNDNQNINLIVTEANEFDEIDFSQAAYGEEIYDFSNNLIKIIRDTGGFFFKEEYSHKIAGIISAHRLDHRIISGYKNVLYISPHFEDLMDVIKAGVPIDEVLTFRDIPLYE
ncbi:hypothetical protein PO903_13565 [Paenibacillus sp. PK4536]|uniref:hypothetical protein n=1 Tax=Paenibacillus sp. PK4536 TaxID=3024576 RepID=UPI002359F32F|nr:hypothetical protein [Paenibacillus sp. PK4536]WIM37680.1 hypothetical protein PO903_13565 [Paenibacillus sp. PK4536]